MKLEEAIKYLDMMNKKINFNLEGYVYGNEAIETVVKDYKNSIPKKRVEDKIQELKPELELRHLKREAKLQIRFLKSLLEES